MNKKQLNPVLSSDLVAIAAGLGFTVEEQAGFHKVHGPEGRYVYISRTKQCTRVDVSGFTLDPNEHAVYDLDEDEQHGGVKQQLRFDLEPQAICEGLARALLAMKELPPVVKAAKAKKEAAKQKKMAASVDVSSVLAAVQAGVKSGSAREHLDEAAAKSGVAVHTGKKAEDMDEAELERATAPAGGKDEDEISDAEMDRIDAQRERRGVTESVPA